MSEEKATQVLTRDDGACRPDADGGSFDPVDGIARLITVAALYPPGHPRIVDIADPVLAAVRAAAADAPFEISSRVRAEDAHGAASSLRRSLDALGISRIELARDATTDDLLAFANFLRKQAGGGPGAELRHADLSDLPPSIRVHERQFDEASFRGGENKSEDQDGDAPATGEASTVTEQEILALIRLAVSRHADEAPRAGAASATNPVNRREQIRAVAETVRTWIDRQSKGSSGTRTAAEIMEEAERELPQLCPGVEWSTVLDGIGRSIDLFMRDRFRLESRADFDLKATSSTEAEDAETSEEELADAVAKLTCGAAAFDVVDAVDGGERLTILLHMLGAAGSRVASEGIATRLADHLKSPLPPRERAVLVGWLRDICRQAQPSDLDRRLAPLASAMRSQRRSAMAELLLETCAAPGRDAAGPLWPHLAYELVTYDESAGEEGKATLESLVVGVPRTRIQEEAQRLVAVVTRGAAPAATSVFLPPRPALYPLYEILIDTPRRAGFTVVLTTAFKRHPPHCAEAGALVALAPTDDRARRLVARLLRERDAPSTALRAFAVEILVETLRRLPPTRRDEVWVETAIRALGKLPCAASREMVREVLGGRRFLFNCTWPEFARRAAADALAGAAA